MTRQQKISREIVITHKDGKIIPKCFRSELFCKIAGTETMSAELVDHARSLGFFVRELTL